MSVKGFKLLDLQIPDRYFMCGKIFKTKEEVLDILIDYHSTDFQDDVYKSYLDYFEKNKINTVESRLKEMLCFGDWKLEEVTK